MMHCIAKNTQEHVRKQQLRVQYQGRVGQSPEESRGYSRVQWCHIESSGVHLSTIELNRVRWSKQEYSGVHCSPVGSSSVQCAVESISVQQSRVDSSREEQGKVKARLHHRKTWHGSDKKWNESSGVQQSIVEYGTEEASRIQYCPVESSGVQQCPVVSSGVHWGASGDQKSSGEYSTVRQCGIIRTWTASLFLRRPLRTTSSHFSRMLQIFYNFSQLVWHPHFLRKCTSYAVFKLYKNGYNF